MNKNTVSCSTKCSHYVMHRRALHSWEPFHFCRDDELRSVAMSCETRENHFKKSSNDRQNVQLIQWKTNKTFYTLNPNQISNAWYESFRAILSAISTCIVWWGPLTAQVLFSTVVFTSFYSSKTLFLSKQVMTIQSP